jgi:hypothetical protein
MVLGQWMDWARGGRLEAEANPPSPPAPDHPWHGFDQKIGQGLAVDDDPALDLVTHVAI